MEVVAVELSLAVEVSCHGGPGHRALMNSMDFELSFLKITLLDCLTVFHAYTASIVF